MDHKKMIDKVLKVTNWTEEDEKKLSYVDRVHKINATSEHVLKTMKAIHLEKAISEINCARHTSWADAEEFERDEKRLQAAIALIKECM
jgi:Trm5-related predicted tRNA methylase